MNSDFSAVMETDDFLSLDIKQVMEWVSSDDITVNAEEEVFKGIVKWVSHNRSEREVEFPALLRQIRLASIPHDFLLNKLVKEELFAKNTGTCLNFVLLDAMRLTVSGACEQVAQQPRKCLEIHTDAIFVCGGCRSLCYFPEQNVWYKLSEMLFQHDHRSNPSQCRGKIYTPCRGKDRLDGSSLMECYTPSTNSWAAFRVSKAFTSTAVLKGHLYTTGGGLSSGEIYRYDPEEDYCSQLKKPHTNLFDSCLVTDEQYIYLIGGIIGGSPFSTTYRLDPSADDHEWEEVAPINQARCNAFGAAMNGKVYIAGGRQCQEALNTCEVYNPLTNEWQLMPCLKVPRISASMVCHEGRLYVLGGVIPTAATSIRVLSVEIFDSEQNEWKEKSVIPVDHFETSEGEMQRNTFKACSARLCKGVIEKLEPLNM